MLSKIRCCVGDTESTLVEFLTPNIRFLIQVTVNLIIPVLRVSMVVLCPVFEQPPLRLSALF